MPRTITNREKTPRRRLEGRSELDPTLQRRVVIEGVRPQVDGGRFPIKRVPGERVDVTADIFADGHDVLAAVLLWRAAGDAEWRESPMELLENDRWGGEFTVDRLGRYEYTIEAWVDRFESWRHDLSTKSGAGQDVATELLEGAMIVRQAARERLTGDDTLASSAARLE